MQERTFTKTTIITSIISGIIGGIIIGFFAFSGTSTIEDQGTNGIGFMTETFESETVAFLTPDTRFASDTTFQAAGSFTEQAFSTAETTFGTTGLFTFPTTFQEDFTGTV